MNKIEYQDDIIVYEEFLTKEECEAIIKLLDIKISKNQFSWMPISFYESYSSGMPEDNDPDVLSVGLPGNFFSELEKRVKQVTSETAKKDVDQMSKISFHTQRWIPGAFAHFHSDNSSNEGELSAFERSRYATFIYLNDDFEGGVLNFKADYGKNEFTLTPKTGMLASFHGGAKNLHEVTVIKNNPRYTIGSFWDDREEEDYPQELRDSWAAEIAAVRAMQKIQQKEWEEVREKGLRITPMGEEYPAEEVISHE